MNGCKLSRYKPKAYYEMGVLEMVQSWSNEGIGERIVNQYRHGALTTNECFALIITNFEGWGESATIHLTTAELESFAAFAREIRSPGVVVLITSVGNHSVSVGSFEALQRWINRLDLSTSNT